MRVDPSDDYKRFRADGSADDFQILTGEEVAVVLGLLFALLLAVDGIARLTEMLKEVL